MLNKFEARLCPIYRSLDECVEVLSDLGYLERYDDRARVGFALDEQRRVLDNIQATATLLNRLMAVYRDMACLADDVPRVKFDAAAGAPELSNSWDEASLRSEVLWFLGAEAEAVRQMLESASEIERPPEQ